MSDVASRLSWQLEVYKLLNESTRPVGASEPMLSLDEQREMKTCWANGWSCEAFVEMLNKRDNHIKLVG